MNVRALPAARTLRLLFGIAVAAFGLLALFCSLWFAWTTFNEHGAAWGDYRTYIGAFGDVIAGRSPYAEAQLAGPYRLDRVVLDGYAYPPPSALFFAPFAIPVVGLPLWLGLNVGLLIGGLLAVIHQERGRVTFVAFGLLLLALASFWPFAVGVVSGNANVGLAGLLALAWVRRSERHPSFAPAVAVAGLLKLVPGVLIGWQWRWQGLRPVVVTILVGSGIVLVTLPITGIPMWVDFVVALRNAQPLCVDRMHISIACLTTPTVGPEIAKLAGLGVGLLALAAMWGTRSRLVAYVLLGVALVAPITDVHQHTWLFTFVVLTVAILVVRSGSQQANLEGGYAIR